MQNIAANINLSETAFVLEKNGELFIRWFTPTVEVDLCGHATLAAAHVLHEKFGGRLVFESGLYTLPVELVDGMLVLDFPMAELHRVDVKDVPVCFSIAGDVPCRPVEAFTANDEYLLVFETQKQIEVAVCDLAKAAQIDRSGFIITAKADMPGFDFVSRYFAPKIGIDEDPVTGSAHTILVPFWRKAIDKDEFCAAQLSARGGVLHCRAEGDRVKIGGEAVTFLTGEISLTGVTSPSAVTPSCSHGGSVAGSRLG